MSAGTPAPRRAQRREREQRRRRPRTRWIVIAGALVLVLVAGGTATALCSTVKLRPTMPAAPPRRVVPAEPVVFADDVPAAAAGTEPCTTVTVMSSFENAEMVATSPPATTPSRATSTACA